MQVLSGEVQQCGECFIGKGIDNSSLQSVYKIGIPYLQNVNVDFIEKQGF